MFAVAIPRSALWLAAFVLLATALPAKAQDRTTILTLDQAQSRARAFSPLLKAADLERLAVLARRDQAGRRPNPTLNLDSENFAGSGDYQGFGASEVVLSVGQEFDLSGKRGARRDLLHQEAAFLEFERERTRLGLDLEVALAFASVWYAQETVDLALDRKALAEELTAEIKVRLQAGGCSPIDLTRARVGLAAAAVAVNQANEQLDSATRGLSSLWGAEVPDFGRVSIPRDFWDQPVPEVSSASVAHSPDLARLVTARQIQAARLAATRAASGLDLEVALGIKLDNATGDRALTLGAGIPLPVSDRNQDELRALGHESDRVEKIQQDETIRAVARLGEAVADRNIASHEMASLAQDIIPLARQAYDETHTAHQRGLYGLTEVLETRRTLFELRQAEMDAKHRFLLATASITRLTGHSLDLETPAAPEEK